MSSNNTRYNVIYIRNSICINERWQVTNRHYSYYPQHSNSKSWDWEKTQHSPKQTNSNSSNNAPKRSIQSLCSYSPFSCNQLIHIHTQRIRVKTKVIISAGAKDINSFHYSLYIHDILFLANWHRTNLVIKNICINVKKWPVFVFLLYNTIHWDIYIHIFIPLVLYRNI